MIYNVMGQKVDVQEVLARFGLETVDCFLSTPEKLDVNVELPDELVDDFTDACEESGLSCEMV